MVEAVANPAYFQGTDSDAFFRFSEENFRYISSLAKSLSGLDIGASKRDLVYGRLARRVRALGLTDFDAYCHYVDTSGDLAEKASLISALTTNVTAFFRESHHFDDLAAYLDTEWCGRRSGGQPLRVWCAATSSGEEAYSVAMVIEDRIADAARKNARILASDINPEMLKVGRHGVYPTMTLGRIPKNFSEKFCILDESKKEFRFREPVRAIVRFRPLNLIANWPMEQRFHVIFCRNVAIYFDNQTKKRLWGRLADRLAPGGRLYLGHSENIQAPEHYGLMMDGITTYRKCGL